MKNHLLSPLLVLRYSLVVVWLWTGFTSLWEWEEQSRSLLQSGGVTDASWQAWLIASGALADITLGLWLWWRPSRCAYGAAAAMMLLMTLVATAMLPALWLHPLGPLSKNLPIAAALWLLMCAKPAHHKAPESLS
jgi:hypothetical protein